MSPPPSHSLDCEPWDHFDDGLLWEPRLSIVSCYSLETKRTYSRWKNMKEMCPYSIVPIPIDSILSTNNKTSNWCYDEIKRQTKISREFLCVKFVSLRHSLSVTSNVCRFGCHGTDCPCVCLEFGQIVLVCVLNWGSSDASKSASRPGQHENGEEYTHNWKR